MRKRWLWEFISFSFILFGAYTLSPAQPPDVDSSGQIVALYAIQVGAFSVMGNAEKLAGEMKAKGFNALIYDNLLDGKNLLHLVWVGRFDTREEALPIMEKIEKLTGIRGVLREQMIWRRREDRPRSF